MKEIELLYIFTINDKLLSCSYVWYVIIQVMLINPQSAVAYVCAFVELLGL